MKRKPNAPAKRNPFGLLAARGMQRKAGSHSKPEKALRREAKVKHLRGLSSVWSEQPVFTRQVESLNLSAPTKRAFLKAVRFQKCFSTYAQMAKLVDATDSKSVIERCAGSIPALGTKCPEISAL